MKTLTELLTKYKDVKPQFPSERTYPINAVIDMIEEAKADALADARIRAMEVYKASGMTNLAERAGNAILPTPIITL